MCSALLRITHPQRILPWRCQRFHKRSRQISRAARARHGDLTEEEFNTAVARFKDDDAVAEHLAYLQQLSDAVCVRNALIIGNVVVVS